MKAATPQVTLDQLATGTRLLVRSRTDWRFASVARVDEERVVLTVCAPTGRTYRLRRDLDAAVTIDGPVPILLHEAEDTWRDNFSPYDIRW